MNLSSLPPSTTPMPTRIASTFAVPPADDPLRPNYATKRDDHQFAKQYANLYWLRLVVLRKRVLERARRRWEGKDKIEGALHSSFACTRWPWRARLALGKEARHRGARVDARSGHQTPPGHTAL